MAAKGGVRGAGVRLCDGARAARNVARTSLALSSVASQSGFSEAIAAWR